MLCLSKHTGPATAGGARVQHSSALCTGWLAALTHLPPPPTHTAIELSTCWKSEQQQDEAESVRCLANCATGRAPLPGAVWCPEAPQVLTGQSLATFSLVDCVQSLLGRTLEVLGPQHMAQLWAEVQGRPLGTAAAGGQPPLSAGGAAGAAARYVGGAAQHSARTGSAWAAVGARLDASCRAEADAAPGTCFGLPMGLAVGWSLAPAPHVVHTLSPATL